MPHQLISEEVVLTYAERALKRFLTKAYAESPLRKRIRGMEASKFQADLTVCSAVKMAKINLTFRKKNKSTDVLSFPADVFFQNQGLLGDIVLCTPVLLDQADEVGHSWKKEVDVLLVHGLLHLLHFDHEKSEKDAKEMSKWEKKFLGAAYEKGLITRSVR